MKDIKFGNRLKRAIKESPYTQKDLTKELNLSKNTLSHYVQGRIPKADVLSALCDLLNVSAEELLKGKDHTQRLNEPACGYGDSARREELLAALRSAEPARRQRAQQYMLYLLSCSENCDLSERLVHLLNDQEMEAVEADLKA